MYGLSPMESFYDTAQMRNHLISCLENSDLSPFPKVKKKARVEIPNIKVLTI